MRPTSAPSRLSLALIGGLAAVGLTASPASAAVVPVDLACRATPPIGSAQDLSIGANVDGTAPATVPSGSGFTAKLAPEAMTVPGTVGDYTVKSLSNLKLTVPVPANATLNGASLSGGSGLGSGTPTVATSGSNVVVTVPGPITGGSSFTLPSLSLDLTAGAAGNTVQTRIAGTGYSDPGLTFTAAVKASILTVNVPTACYPSPSPVLTSTAIG
ncbi:cyclase [Streptomyces thermolineatus]|uniref:Cyclase n=1 Tax=Streptomyces thermolineatus TaxID=44033 RepID=A0ABN3KPM3_9ACTN